MYFFWYLGNNKNLTKINLRDIDGCFLIYNLDCLDDHGKLGSLLGLLKLLLGLAELSQVEGSNLLSLLNLLLVGLDLHLQLAGKLRHAVLVLLVLTLGKGKLLSLALSSLVSLGGLTSAGLDGGKLSLKLTDLSFKLSHGSLARLEGNILSIRKTSLKFSKSIGKRVLSSSKAGNMFLLSTEFISKTSSINHSLLGLLLGILGSNQHTINLSLKGVDAGFKLALGCHVTAIDGLHVVNSTSGVSNVILELSDGAVGTIKKSLALLNLSRESSSLTLRDSNLLSNLSLGASLILKGLDGLTKLSLVSLPM